MSSGDDDNSAEISPFVTTADRRALLETLVAVAKVAEVEGKSPDIVVDGVLYPARYDPAYWLESADASIWALLPDEQLGLEDRKYLETIFEKMPETYREAAKKLLHRRHDLIQVRWEKRSYVKERSLDFWAVTLEDWEDRIYVWEGRLKKAERELQAAKFNRDSRRPPEPRQRSNWKTIWWLGALVILALFIAQFWFAR